MLSRAKILSSAGLCVALLIPAAHNLHAETAILECTSDSATPAGAGGAKAPELQGPATIFFGFKVWNIFKWNVESAELFLHVGKGPVPPMVEVAVVPSPWSEPDPPAAAAFKFVSHKATAEPQGWLSIKVDPKLVQEITAGKGHGLAVRIKSATSINTRESASKPYLIVNGGRQ